jgi:hypothetical protein
LTAIAGVGVLVVALAAIDTRVRDQLYALASGRAPTGELADAGQRLHDVTMTIALAVRDQSIEHAALTIFALGALVLVGFMLRT